MEFSFGPSRIVVNMRSRADVMSEIRRRFADHEGFSLATVNLDHLVKMRADPAFAAVYARQDLIVADGRPIVWLSRMAGRPVELVPGSELVLPLTQLARDMGVKVALIGSTEKALEDAAEVLKSTAQGVDIPIRVSPPFGFDPKGDDIKSLLAGLQGAGIGLCFLALGAPKQERLADLGRQLAPGVGFASIGAGLDFLGGHQKRAPVWMRRAGVEWLWRAVSNPVRMVPRYAKCIAILPGEMAAARRLRNTT